MIDHETKIEVLNSILNSSKDNALLDKFVKSDKKIDLRLNELMLLDEYIDLGSINNELCIKKILKKNHLRNTIIKNEISFLSQELNKHNIEYCFIKGASLFSTVYDSYGSRYLSDIDILISKKSYESFFHIIEKKLNIKSKFISNYDYQKSKINHSIDTLKLHSGIYLDIHSRITSPMHFERCPISDYVIDSSYIYSELDNAKIATIESSYLICIYNGFLKNGIHKKSNFIIDLLMLEKKIQNQELIKNLAIKYSLSKEYNLSRKLIDAVLSKKLDRFTRRILKLNSSNIKINYKRFLWLIRSYIFFSKSLTIEKYGSIYFERKFFYRIKFFLDKFNKIFKT